MKRRAVRLSFVVAAAGLVTMFLVYFLKGNPAQPIAFNHKKHAENNVHCGECHALAMSSARAGMPGISVCKKCHEDVIYLSAEKKKLLHYVNGREEIPWKRVYTVPEHVFFSHKRHVVAGRLACALCHGEVASLRLPFREPVVELNMTACIDCHRDSYKNPNECIACHR